MNKVGISKVKPKSVSELFLKAAEWVRLGWCQHYRHKDGGAEVCVLGAMENAYVGRRLTMNDVQALSVGSGYGILQFCQKSVTIFERLVPKVAGGPTWGAADWNNAPGRTAEEVALKLEEASKVAALEEATC